MCANQDQRKAQEGVSLPVLSINPGLFFVVTWRIQHWCTLLGGENPFCVTVTASASFLAELSLRSPRKLIIFIIYKNIFWIKVSKKYFI